MIEVHNRLQIALEDGENLSASSHPSSRYSHMRVGRILLSQGAMIKSAHTTYWGNHPKAVCIFGLLNLGFHAMTLRFRTHQGSS